MELRWAMHPGNVQGVGAPDERNPPIKGRGNIIRMGRPAGKRLSFNGKLHELRQCKGIPQQLV